MVRLPLPLRDLQSRKQRALVTKPKMNSEAWIPSGVPLAWCQCALPDSGSMGSAWPLALTRKNN